MTCSVVAPCRTFGYLQRTQRSSGGFWGLVLFSGALNTFFAGNEAD